MVSSPPFVRWARGLTARSEVDLPAGKVLLLSWNRNGNNYLGHSAYRAVWYLVKVRAELVKLIGISLSREAGGRAHRGVEGSRRIALCRAALATRKAVGEHSVPRERIVGDAQGVGRQVDLLPGANRGTWLRRGTSWGTPSCKTVLRSNSLGVNNTGSRSVGEVHDGTADSFVSGVLAWIEGVINGNGSRPYEGLVRDIIDLNWGTQAVGAYPQVKLELKQAKIGIAERAPQCKRWPTGGAHHHSRR